MVYEILEKLTDIDSKNQEKLDDAQRFIQFYKKILEEKIDMNSEKAQLAREIYKNNREIIDYINECTKNMSSISTAGAAFINEYNKAAAKDYALEKCTENPRNYFFIDSVLKNTSGGADKDKDWRGGAVCGYFFTLWGTSDDGSNGKLQLNIEVGPFEDSAKRSEFLNLLSENGFKFQAPKKENPKYTKISYGKKLVENIDDITDEEEIEQKMTELFGKAKVAVERLHECAEKFAAE